MVDLKKRVMNNTTQITYLNSYSKKLLQKTLSTIIAKKKDKVPKDQMISLRKDSVTLLVGNNINLSGKERFYLLLYKASNYFKWTVS